MSTGGRKRCSWWPSTSCTRGPGTASAPTRWPGGDPIHAFDNADPGDPLRAVPRAVPRGGDPAAVPAVPRLHPVLEHVLRHGPLRRHARRLRPAVLEAARGVPGVAQQPRDHDRPGHRRLRAVPADAAAAARQAVRPTTAGRASRATLRPRGRRSGSPTRCRSTAGRGRSTPTRWPASPTSTRRCRACTSAGRCGAPSPCGRCCGGAGNGRWCSSIPLATLFCIIVTANHYWIDGVGGLFCFAVGTVAGWGLHRWNQNRLDRKFMAELDGRRPRRRDDRDDQRWPRQPRRRRLVARSRPAERRRWAGVGAATPRRASGTGSA